MATKWKETYFHSINPYHCPSMSRCDRNIIIFQTYPGLFAIKNKHARCVDTTNLLFWMHIMIIFKMKLCAVIIFSMKDKYIIMINKNCIWMKGFIIWNSTFMLYNIQTEIWHLWYIFLMEIIPSVIISYYCLRYQSHNNI